MANVTIIPLQIYCLLKPNLLAASIIQILCNKGYVISDDGEYRCVTDRLYNPQTLPTCNGEFDIFWINGTIFNRCIKNFAPKDNLMRTMVVVIVIKFRVRGNVRILEYKLSWRVQTSVKKTTCFFARIHFLHCLSQENSHEKAIRWRGSKIEFTQPKYYYTGNALLNQWEVALTFEKINGNRVKCV